MESGASLNISVTFLDEGGFGPKFIHPETNREESQSLLVLFENTLQEKSENVNFHVFLSAFSSFSLVFTQMRGKEDMKILSLIVVCLVQNTPKLVRNNLAT